MCVLPEMRPYTSQTSLEQVSTFILLSGINTNTCMSASFQVSELIFNLILTMSLKTFCCYSYSVYISVTEELSFHSDI